MPYSENKEKAIYSSRTIDPYIKLIKSRYPTVDIEELLSYAGIETWEAADQSHWFTQTQINLFYERAAELTHNPDLAHEAGLYCVSPDAFGFVRTYALSFINPHTMFDKIGDVVHQLTRSSIYASRKITDTGVEITVSPLEGIKEESFQCRNRMGVFEAGIENFNYKLESIDHPECMFRGDKVCRYVVRWQVTKAAKLKRMQNLSMVVLPFLNVPIALYDPAVLLATIPLSIAVFTVLGSTATSEDLRDANNSMEQLFDSRDQLMEQLDANYNNAMLTSEIGHAISSFASIDRVLNAVVKVLSKRLDFDRGMIMLTNDDRTRLSYRAGFGHIAEHRMILERATFRLDNPDSRGVFIEAYKEQTPFLVNDFEGFERRHTTHSVNIAKALGVKSFVCCPIICEGESVGVLAVDNLKSSRPLMQRDKSLLMGIAPVIGVAIRNAEHLLAKDKEFRSTLQVLAASIDARDPLTAGHSEKVTEYAVGICDEMDLDVEFRECVRVAALLHDYGKIGVPDAILKKEGRLTAEEYEIIKTHSNKTRDILSQINFEGKYVEVPEIAGAHHEKWNGEGYPDKLAKEDIPFGARIVAVADFFEAITSKRHYRESMPIQVALDEVVKESGEAFDPCVVDAFLRYYKHYNGGPYGESGGGGGENVCSIRPRRISVESLAEVRTEKGAMEGQTSDVSSTGAYLSVPEDINEGLFIRVTLHLPGLDRPLEAAGRVAWVNSGDRRPKPHFPEGVGVEFTDFPEDCERSLQEFVDQNLPKTQVSGSVH